MSKQSPASRNKPTAHQPPSSPALARAQARIAELEAEVAALRQREAAARQQIAEIEAAARHEPGPNLTHTISHARLNTLLAVGAALLVTHDIEPVLNIVVRESLSLFPGTHGALLFLHDPETQRLMLRIARGTHTTELALLARQELTDQAFLAPRAMLLAGSDLDDILIRLNLADYTDIHQLLEPWPPQSILLAPLRDENRHMGALVLYRSQPNMLYQPGDLPFVQALADLAAMAITETYQRARAAALQRDLAQTRFLHREAQARLDAAQAQLLQSAKLAAVGELAASVAHEINNPLYAARNSLYLIEQDTPLDHPLRQFLDIAQSELGRIASIITRMRDFYRPSRAELSPTNINSLLRDTIEFVQVHLRHSHIIVRTELEPDLPLITAHMDQLRQVFLNLVLNACDAMTDGGCLSLRTQALPPTSDQLGAIVIRVADTGMGIPAEHIPHIFEPFYTTKPQGTGLGLAISAHIVTQHAGQITVESTVNLGTTFTITLPLNAPNQQAD